MRKETSNIDNYISNSILENSPMGILFINFNGTIKEINTIAAKFIGTKRSHLLNKNFIENTIKHKNEQTQLFRIIVKAINNNKTNSRLIFTNLKGEIKHLAIKTNLVKNYESNGILVFAQDIEKEVLAIESNKTTQEHYRAIVENSHDAIYIYKNNHFHFVNNKMCELSGYSKEELIKLTVWEMVHPEDVDRLQTYAKARMKGEKAPGNHEAKVICKDGTIKNCSFSVKTVRFQNGYGVIGQVRDISVEIEMRTTLIESNRKFKSIFDHAPLGIMYFDKKGTILDCNYLFINIIGSNKKSLIGFNVKSQLQNEELKLQFIKTLKDGSGYFDGPYTSVTGNKTTIARIIIKGIKNEKDEIYAGICLVEDITERRKQEIGIASDLWFHESLDQTEVALRSSLDIQKSINNLLKVLSSRFRSDGTFLAYIDDSLETYDIKYDYSTSSHIETKYLHTSIIKNNLSKIIKQKKPTVIYSDDDKIIENVETSRVFDSILCTVVRPNQGNPWLFVICDSNKQRIWNKHEIKLLEEVGNRLTDTLNIMHTLAHLENSREELRQNSESLKLSNENLKTALAKAEESDNLKSLFLANMSHEIRTPMNGIIGFSDLMTKEYTTDKDRISYATIINNSSKLLLRLISDIVDISKLEAKQVKLYYKEHNLNEIIYSIYNHHTISLKEEYKNNVKIKYKTDFSDDYFIETDEIRLKQIITNLLGNAIKFTKKGQIEFGYKKINDSLLQFYVKDTGIGIGEEDKKYIFTRFGQALSTNKAHFGGAGLGLSISTELVKMFGGEIWVDSIYGKGSTFYFTYPLKSKLVIKNNTEMHNELFKLPNWDGYNLLVVDDSHTAIKLFEVMLKPTNSKLKFANSGEGAIDIIKKNKDIDLVLMDLRMPGMDGLEATSALKMLRPKLPVIAQTAYALSGDREIALSNGCDDYISKPINFEELINVINKHI
ncbi:MAG: hypothetical protein C0595_05160 [Marinilabiliales bacterium]|nr:MAG: hypothetical protein C0595_05160 [Marinilabiliales bacterium]